MQYRVVGGGVIDGMGALAALRLENLELPQRAQLPPQPNAPLPAAAADAHLYRCMPLAYRPGR